MKASALVIVLSLFAVAANARPVTCFGQEGTLGQITVDLRGQDIQVSGAYRFTAERGQALHQMGCTGHLANNGQNGVSAHDYYELHGNCSVNYIRTEKDQTGRLTGWVSLVNRGPAQEDGSGYEYHFFLCQ